MPGCAAIGCSNSYKKGFLMKNFPKEPARRKLFNNVHIPNCHKLLDIIINRYVLFRLKIAGKNKIKLANKYGSKSVANHL